jgi:tight adherence protein C
MLTYFIMAAAFLTAFLIVLSFSMPVLLKNRKKTGLPTLSFYDDNTEQERIKVSAAAKNTTSVFKRIIKFLRKFLPKNLVVTIKEKIEMAGIYDPLIIDMILVVKFFTPVILLATLLFLMIFFNVQVFVRLLLILLVPISFIFPDFYLKSKISKRHDTIRKSLPNALDLLTISVEAGLGFDQALFKVSKSIKGVLGGEFLRVIKEMEIGVSRKEALKNLRKRTDVAELNAFIFSIIQADIFGISIGKVLRIQSNEMRIKRRQMAEEKGMKAPVKLVFPTILFLLPALMVIILGPAIINIMDTLGVFGK